MKLPMKACALGVNVDHIATLRNVRGETYPNLISLATIAIESGANNLTAHLREDRRHILDKDIPMLQTLSVPLNMEMAPTDEMIALAHDFKPEKICLVPERREELTTEGGLDLSNASLCRRIAHAVDILGAHSQISLFIEPNHASIQQSQSLGAQAVELHTGAYARFGNQGAHQLAKKACKKIEEAAFLGDSLGLCVHAGHGLHQQNLVPIASIAPIVELNIGHSIISDALTMGMANAVASFKDLIFKARTNFS